MKGRLFSRRPKGEHKETIVDSESRDPQDLRNANFSKAVVDSGAKTSRDPDDTKRTDAPTSSSPPDGIDPRALKIVEDWTRDGKIPKVLLEGSSANNFLYPDIISIYKVVKILNLHDLQNQIMDICWRLHSRRRERAAPSFIAFLERTGLADTPYYTMALRSSIAALMSGRFSNERWENDISVFGENPRAMKDMLIYVRRWVKDGPWKRPGRDDICDYHIHPDGSRCISGSGSGPGAPSDEDKGSDDEYIEETLSHPTGGAGDA